MKQPGSDEFYIQRDARKILRFLALHKSSISPLLILTHDYPDPDSLASAYGLGYLAAQAYGISCRIAYGGTIGRVENKAMVQVLKIPVHKLRPGDLRRYKHVAMTDTQPGFENNPFPPKRRAALVIDQHPSSIKPNARLAIVNENCGATAVLLAQCLLIKKIDIPVKLATALVYGILSDTMNLFRCHNRQVVETYLAVLSYSDLRTLALIQNPTRSRSFFATLARGIHNAVFQRGVVVSHLGPVQNPTLIAQVADFLLAYRKARWCMCTGKCRDRMHVSLRATKPTPSAESILCKVLPKPGQAGGHDQIAGGNVRLRRSMRPGSYVRLEQRILHGLLKHLHIKAAKRLRYPFR